MTPAERLAQEKGRAKKASRRRAAAPVPKLREIRKSLGLKQGEVAESLGFAQSHYCAIENGERDTRLSAALRIAAFFGRDVSDLWEMPPSPETEAN